MQIWFNYIEFVVLIMQFLYAVPCPSVLTDPTDGIMICSLGDDGIPSYGDTCSFTCNTGYKLIGSETRTCGSDGSWSGSETMCITGQQFLCYIACTIEQ